MRKLICLLVACLMVTAGCASLKNGLLSREVPRFAVVDWDRLVKQHPKYKEWQKQNTDLDSAKALRERQLKDGHQQLAILGKMRSLAGKGRDRFRSAQLAAKIAALTEDLEELRSEKALLVQKFEYAEDAGAEAFRKDIAIMEAGLKKLEAQEQKYSAELDKALDEYDELKAQAADFDSVELYKARQVLRPAQEKAAERQLEETLQKKPSFSLLLSAKQEISRLLGEDTEERQARQMVIRRRRSDPQKPKPFQR